MDRPPPKRSCLSVRGILILAVILVALYFLLRGPIGTLYTALTSKSGSPTPTPTITSAPAPTSTPFRAPATKPPATVKPGSLPLT